MKHNSHGYDRKNNYYDEDLYVQYEDNLYEIDESRIKGMTKKQARRFSSRKSRIKNKPNSYD